MLSPNAAAQARYTYADALVAEAEFIRKYLPRYNKDGVTQ